MEHKLKFVIFFSQPQLDIGVLYICFCFRLLLFLKFLNFQSQIEFIFFPYSNWNICICTIGIFHFFYFELFVSFQWKCRIITGIDLYLFFLPLTYRMSHRYWANFWSIWVYKQVQVTISYSFMYSYFRVQVAIPYLFMYSNFRVWDGDSYSFIYSNFQVRILVKINVLVYVLKLTRSWLNIGDS